MKLNKTKKLFLTISALSFAAAAMSQIAFANEPTVPSVPKSYDIAGAYQEETYYSMAIGKVVELSDLSEENESESKAVIRIEKDSEELIDFYVNKNTVIAEFDGLLTWEDIKKGDEIKVFYIMPLVNTMIYPARFDADVIVKTDESTNVHADRFNENLVAGEYILKLNVSDDTIIIDAAGNNVSADELGNKNLLVFYTFTTKSRLPLTTPIKIIVLNSENNGAGYETAEHSDNTLEDSSSYETVVPPIYMLTDEEREMANNLLRESLENAEIFVKGTLISAPTPLVNENGTVMLPVRPIAEALGLSVQWNTETETVSFNNRASLTIGQDAYTNSSGEQVSLYDIPMIQDGHTYAPTLFFENILNTVVVLIDNTVNIGVE